MAKQADPTWWMTDLESVHGHVPNLAQGVQYHHHLHHMMVLNKRQQAGEVRDQGPLRTRGRRI